MPLNEQILGSKEDERWLYPHFEGAQFQVSDRNRFAAGLLAQVHEHALAIRLLLSQDVPGRMFGTVCALIRPVLEGLIRALWILDCATEDVVAQRIANDDAAWRPDVWGMADAVDAQLHTNAFYRGLLDRYYNAMCSYSHGGMRVVANHISEDGVEPTATEPEMAEIMRFVRVIDWIGANAALSMCGKNEVAEECFGRAAIVIAGEP